MINERCGRPRIRVVGLARSDAAARSLAAVGAEAHRGSLDDLDSLHSGAAASDGVIHTAFVHDFADYAGAAATDRRAIEALGEALADSERPFVVTAGLAGLESGRLATAATLTQAHVVPGPIALQLEYSLVQRAIESEHVPAAHAFGLGITPWSPLAGGFLTGKYQREGEDARGQGRLKEDNPFQGPYTKFTPHNWRVLDTLREVSAQVGRPPAQVALAWTLAQPGVTAPILGANKIEQLHDNLAALDLTLSPEQLDMLSNASAPDLMPFFTPTLNRMIFGGSAVQR